MRLVFIVLLSGMSSAQTYKPEAIEQANLGISLSKKEDYAGAIQAYKRALTLDSRLPHLYLNLGLAYFKRGSFREALAAFQNEPASEQTATLIGMSHFGLGQFSQAAAALAPLAQAHPENGELGYLLAKSYLWAGQREKSMEMFRRLLEQDPNSAPVHMLLGEALDADDRESEATAEFEAAVAAGPQLPDVHFSLGYLYWKQRVFEKAEKEFRAELKNNPEHANALAYEGDIMLRDGRGEQALISLKKAEALDPKLHVVHQDLGIFYQNTKRLDQAVTEFQESVNTAPENYDAHYRLARIFKETGRTAEAEREFAVVRKLHEKQDEEPLMRISGPK